MIDIEAWKKVIGTDDVHIGIGQIKKLMVATDRSVLRVLVSIFPEQLEIVCRMSWDCVGPESGFFQFPVPGDLCLIAVPNADYDIPFVIARLTSSEDKIPLNAVDGHTVLKSLADKKIWITSDTRINLSQGDTEPTENVPLGQVLKTLLADLLTLLSTHTHVGNLGYATSAPQEAADFLDLKSDPVDNEGVLSDVTFTEKGS